MRVAQGLPPGGHPKMPERHPKVPSPDRLTCSTTGEARSGSHRGCPVRDVPHGHIVAGEKRGREHPLVRQAGRSRQRTTRRAAR